MTDSNPHYPSCKDGVFPLDECPTYGVRIVNQSSGLHRRSVCGQTAYGCAGRNRTFKHLIQSQAALPICVPRNASNERMLNSCLSRDARGSVITPMTLARRHPNLPTSVLVHVFGVTNWDRTSTSGASTQRTDLLYDNDMFGCADLDSNQDCRIQSPSSYR
jgi:hypothetical protein